MNVHHALNKREADYQAEQRRHEIRRYWEIGLTIGSLTAGAVAWYCLNSYATEPLEDKVIFTDGEAHKFEAQRK